ncbi:MAG: AAA family ATPase [Patescibacteria group bacterium]
MIFLKRLELQGFKSFAGKVSLDFTARVAGIVGPNGSGKSNVIDALKWVLGEREAKQLRGDLLENLIFAGTPKRAAVGLAKVTLYFDNAHGQFPFDAPEVALQRRVDRSGTSEFFINDEEVKLRDLMPMLARAKLGTRGLTMIGQGQSDMFVKSSPEERRLMIEEILGLKEFRIKKNQAERRLTTSAINMDKTRAMLEELLPHLRFLRRQKHRWDKRSEVERELNELENTYYAFQYHKLLRAEGMQINPPEELEKLKKQKEKEAQDLEGSVREIEQKTSVQEKIRAIRDELAQLNTQQLTLERLLARIEVRIEFESKEKNIPSKTSEELSGVITSASKDVEEALLLNDVEGIKTILRKILNTFSGVFKNEEIKEKTENLDEERNKINGELKKLNEEIGRLQKSEDVLTREREEANKQFREQIEILELKKNEIRRLDQQIQTQLFEKEKINIRMGELEREWHALGREVSELKSLPTPIETTIQTEEMERKMFRLRGELAAIGEIDQNLVSEANESEKRYEFLSTELADLEHAITDLRKLIKDLDEKITEDFKGAFKQINEEFNTYFRLMFGGGKARMFIEKKKKPEPQDGEQKTEGEGTLVVSKEEEESDSTSGVEIELNLPKKKITNLEMLSGGEKSLVSVAALFALIAVSPPPFLVLDEVDAPLDESNARRFADLIQDFSKKTQFIIVTHNRSTMEAADILYGVTMADDGVSKILSLKFEEAPKA